MSNKKVDGDATPSTASPTMYETPSPPSTASSPDIYAPDSTVVTLPPEDGPISPIHPPTAWQRSFIPVLADETTPLVPQSPTSSDVALSRADLQRAYGIHDETEDKNRGRDRFVLGCSVLIITGIVFIVIVSGFTTMLANRNFPQLEVYSDWPNGGIIPLKYGCHAPDGNPISIPLHWRNIPRQATNLAVLFANPGRIKESGIDPVHWFVTDIPLNNGAPDSIPANASRNSTLLPSGVRQHANAFSKEGGYWPPCVRNGTSFFAVHIYAIDASPNIDNCKDAREVMNRFVGVPVARITGTYGKPSKAIVPAVNDGSNADSGDADVDTADDDPQGVGDYHGIEGKDRLKKSSNDGHHEEGEKHHEEGEKHHEEGEKHHEEREEHHEEGEEHHSNESSSSSDHDTNVHH